MRSSLFLAIAATSLVVPSCADESGGRTSGGGSTGGSGVTITVGAGSTSTGAAGTDSTGGVTTAVGSDGSSGGGASSSSSSGPGDGSTSTTGGPAVCGNNMLEGDEVCDLTQLGGETCESLGYQGGMLGCNLTCDDYNLLGCFICGNGVIDGPEDCEGGMVPMGVTCESMGFESGELVCGVDCLYDTTDCAICGDGIQQGDEVCDGVDLAGEDCASLGLVGGTLACNASCNYDTSACDVTNRIIFVSSVMFDGDLGGLLGADAECQALANAAGLPGVYMAWLSSNTESPSTRMTPSAQPYVRPDGVQVAPNWAGLVDGNLDAPINVTETGGAAPIGNTSCAGGGFPTVWSATTATGASSGGSNCTNWTSTAGGSQWGRADATDGQWTSWCSGGICSWVSPIYCVQQ